ncbi:YhgE/Pip domain-containing protein [Alkalicoccobacillus plakortidis]|uniref:YhgE/Pip family protein n=1 Tax=Alkalicoccobacillus plakortidis TaxID=444060 RepID=A0ABT0XMZ6_9BACI|nr:YhgE/Pip domain-containing protein [Alkalicoccobacillus plakortidis]MCM2677271.1 YhgE/Pip family protein [Alkalicoccobacillus plakortidis]
MNMIKAEWKKLLTNRKLLVVVLALLIIPSMYAGIFLASSWDPYGNADQLPVAIVNEDQAVEYEGETLQIGQDLIENLEDNDSLDWHMPNRDEAMEGLENGDYYMVVVIPDTFSEHASTVLDDHPQKMNLEYYTSGGQNYIAQKISESAAKELNQEIAETVTKEYAETMFTKLDEVGDGFQDGSDGATELKDGNQKLEDNLQKIADSTVTFQDGANSAEEGGEKLEVNVGTAASGASDLAEGIHSYTEGVGSLNSGLQQYTAWSKRLK